jgi:hypothetical protein
VKWLSGFGAWLLCLLAGGVMLGAAVLPMSFFSSDTVQPSLRVLEKHSVYVHPEARAVLDEKAARRIVGSRPVLVAVFPEREADHTGTLCEEIVGEYDTSVVLVYAGTSGPAICAGGYHDVPKSDGTDDWARQVFMAADFARDAKGAQDDVRTEVTEYVSAYDVAARADLPWGPASRDDDKRWGSWKDVVDALGGMACGVLMLFWCAVVAFWRFSDVREAWRERRVARAERLAQVRR